MKPIFNNPEMARYTDEPFPAYRYLPFVTDMPHPRRDPGGHSYGKEDEYLPGFIASDWPQCRSYLYGVDLFNYGYWWEAHEALEAVWHAAGVETPEGQFVQGLIQVAGAQLKRFIKEMKGARLLTESGIVKLSRGQGPYLGVDRSLLISEVERCLEENRGEYPQIKLIF